MGEGGLLNPGAAPGRPHGLARYLRRAQGTCGGMALPTAPVEERGERGAIDQVLDHREAEVLERAGRVQGHERGLQRLLGRLPLRPTTRP